MAVGKLGVLEKNKKKNSISNSYLHDTEPKA